MKPLLAVLAAGAGSRYGGLKQMDPVGPNGETLPEYAAYDAFRAGFGKVVFVIRRDAEERLRETVLSRMPPGRWELAYQDLDTGVPPEIAGKAREAGRTKPWGAVHALLCAADSITTPAFAVTAASGFYGRAAFELMHGYIGAPGITQQKLPTIKQGYLVPYALENTLSPEGPVQRGLCEFAGEVLASARECAAVAREESGIFNASEDGSQEELAPDAPVSVDFWGFPRSVLPGLRKYFFDFLQNPDNAPHRECGFPEAADWLVKNGLLTVRPLKGAAEWFGLAYPGDREPAARRIAELAAQGAYPDRLWENFGEER